MNRPFLAGVLMLAGASALTAAAQQNPYQGTSNPPPDDIVTTEDAAPAKPHPGRPMVSTPARPSVVEPAPYSVDPAPNHPALALPQVAGHDDGTDNGIVMIAPEAPETFTPPSGTSAAPQLSRRYSSVESDPDGDIVHPAPLPPGTLEDGTLIRARLKERISTVYCQDGDPFTATVASDVLQNGEVIIPAGSVIEGVVSNVSTGRFAGHGSLVLRPQTVTIPAGKRLRLYAQVESTPGANTRVGSEGQIAPGSRIKKDGIEYGGGVGAGVIAGGAIGGPVGALAGTIVGASAVTLHLMMDHPQPVLEPGTVLIFSLTQPLHLQAVDSAQRNAGQNAFDGLMMVQ